MAVRDFGVRRATLSRTSRVISAVAVAGLLGAAAFATKDLVRVERENAVQPPSSPAEALRDRPRAEAEWRIARAHLEARLNQANPLELGAVWFTRAGRICGIVNGRGSFGGLSSMVRFFTVDHRPVFHRDIDHVAFQRQWFDCRRDLYVTLHSGPTEPGFCNSALGRRRCYAVVNGVRRDPQ